MMYPYLCVMNQKPSPNKGSPSPTWKSFDLKFTNLEYLDASLDFVRILGVSDTLRNLKNAMNSLISAVKSK